VLSCPLRPGVHTGPSLNAKFMRQDSNSSTFNVIKEVVEKLRTAFSSRRNTFRFLLAITTRHLLFQMGSVRI